MNPQRTRHLRESRQAPKAVRGKKPRLHLEQLEDRTVPTGGVFRSIDGTGNNFAHDLWGSAGVDLLRIAPAEYGNGVSTPAGADRPSPREISNTIVDQGAEDIISNRNLSAMIYAWGQFLDHDLDLTPPGGTESFDIAVPTGDPYFDPDGTGTQTISFTRSIYDAATGTTKPRQQVNFVTAWVDGSQIYGSDDVTARKLRTLSGGRLKTSPGADGKLGTADDLLPYNNATYFPTGTLNMANDAHRVPNDQLFAAGDVRANENVELTSLHTLFVREHNRIADALKKANPNWSDETIYQNARARVIAELQVITYKEWLPALFGRSVGTYKGYNSSVNPGIANEFSTAAFRLGHSLLGDDVEFLDNNGNEVAEEVPLSEAFFNPELLTANGIGPILKYLASDPASELDSTIVNSVRNFLFGPPGAGGFDLASLNIQRGRDHGLADYNAIRASYGLPKVTSFAQITSNADVQQKLEDLYGSVNNIDAWVGALAEDHVAGSSAGPLVQRVVLDQFQHLRDGDRFWYQRIFAGSTLSTLENTTLAGVMGRNTEINNLQNNAFFFRADVSGTVFSDPNRNGRRDFREKALPGMTVNLLNDEDEIIATTLTNGLGNYRFSVQTELRTGTYKIQLVLTGGQQQTTPPRQISVTRGDLSFRNMDFGVAGSSSGMLMASSVGGQLDSSVDASVIDGLFAGNGQ